MAKKVKVIVAEEQTEKDNVTYKKKVIFSIVSLATQEINGIASICRNYVSAIKSVFNKNINKGIAIDFDKNGKVNINVFVNVKFGYSVKDVAFRVQENIKQSVESMTEFKVGQINVNVVGVTFNETDSDFVS
ncbi:MAG: Asp23/Gls24 family envelope stress response protein [Clostridia bacterium]|nr:Asp23/Gls24 family envelope stress response protein [Clostridia bacterium]